MENFIETPEYFMCPISLQIMKDPVTTISGITYDRESIEHWLFKSHNTICPVTKNPLPITSDLTPNHTLRRLIQSWCTLNAVDRIPTPKHSLPESNTINLVKNLSIPDLQLDTLREMEALALENGRNKDYMVRAGLVNALIIFIISCYRNRETEGLKESLGLLFTIRSQLSQSKGPLTENDEIIDSLIWILARDDLFCCDDTVVKSHAALALKTVFQKANHGLVENLKPEFFRSILLNLRNRTACEMGTSSLLHVLLYCCPWGKNRVMMVESGTIFELIELELMNNSEKKRSELVLGIMYHLCTSADGRAHLLNHAAGIALVSKKILKVSPTADDRAVLIIWLISKYCGRDEVLQEMLKVGTVAKLCMVIQANCESHLKDKAREILRMYSDVWKDSPCIEVATLSRYTW